MYFDKITFKFPIPFLAVGLQTNSRSVSRKQWTSTYETKKNWKIIWNTDIDSIR